MVIHFVHIGINGGEYRSYVMPTFADNVAAPVITHNKANYDKVVNDVYSLGNTLIGAGTYRNNTILTSPYQ